MELNVERVLMMGGQTGKPLTSSWTWQKLYWRIMLELRINGFLSISGWC